MFRLLSETNITLRRDTPGGTIQTYTTNVTNSYSGTLLTQTLQDTLKNGSDGAVPDTLQTYSYSWWDGAIQTRIQHDRDHNGGTPDLDWDTQFTLDGSGHVSSVAINDGRDRTVSFIVDQNGMIAHRDEADALAGGDPRTLRYFFAGQQLGMVTNNGTDNLQYVASIRDRLVPLATSDTGGAFRGGSKTARPYADFEQSYDAINGVTADDTSSPYTVNEGDTLQTIALAVWGDASLWYLIAEANGITNGTELVQGQLISLPNKVRNNRNSADTFRPYDPNEALGNLSPTSPKPTKKPKCAMLGQIAMIAIAIAITIVLKVPVTSLLSGAAGAGAGASYTAAAMSAVMSGTAAVGGASTFAAVAGAALTGAVASAASQAFGVAVGAQDRFSFKGVAMAAISAGVSQGIGGGPLSGKAGKLLQGVSRGVLANTAMQGIGLATGLQNRFSWAGLAGAAVSGGIMAGFESGGLPRFDPAHPTLPGLATHIATNTFTGMFDAAARTMIDGTSFGDNVLAVLPDVIGSTIGTMAGHTIAGGRNPASDPRAAPEATPSDADAGGGASAGMRHYKAAAIVGKGVGPGGATPVGTAEGYPPPAEEQEVVVTAYARWMKDFAMSIFGTAGGGNWFDHLYSRQGFFGSNGGGWYGSPSSSQGSSSRQPRFTNDFAIGPALLGMSDPASGRNHSLSVRGFMWRSLQLTNPRARFDLSGGVRLVWAPPPPADRQRAIADFINRPLSSMSALETLNEYRGLRDRGLVPIYSDGLRNVTIAPRLWLPEPTRSQASWGARFLTNFLDLLPIVGTGKAFIQMGTGHDLVTGEEVSFESQALGVTPWSKIAGRIGGRVIGNAAERVAVRGPTGQYYSVAFEMRLSPTSYPGVSRGAHFQEANGSLLRTMEGDAAFARDIQSLGINLQRTPTGLAPRTSPSGWTWHHAEETGVLQLVPRSQHQPGSIFQGALHPNGQGGYSIWGK